MKLICKIAGHIWMGGRCRRCSEIHAEHKWEQIPGKCALRCSVCGKVQETAHTQDAGSIKSLMGELKIDLKKSGLDAYKWMDNLMTDNSGELPVEVFLKGNHGFSKRSAYQNNRIEIMQKPTLIDNPSNRRCLLPKDAPKDIDFAQNLTYGAYYYNL